MEFLKDFFKILLGSFKQTKEPKKISTREEKPIFSNSQLLGVPTSTIENPIKLQKQKRVLFYVAIGVIVISVIIALISFSVIRSGYCVDIEKKVKKETLAYAKKNKLLPLLNGEYTTIELKDIYKEEAPIKFNNKECLGTIKFTKVDENYVQTLNITNCDYCSTEKRYSKWTEETNKYNKNAAIVDVIPYYNYHTLEKYSTSWTTWLASDKVSTKKDKKYNVFLPIDINLLPKINEKAEIISYEVENKNYYSYRDKQWKVYRNNINNYSGLSSTAPNGYPNKDSATEMLSNPSEWSQSYPEEHDYRIITTKIAYRWYYEKDGNKIFWNNGEYLVDSPDAKYKKDSQDNVKIYSYQDRLWRWYYGTERRNYSGSYASVSTSSYPYMDSEISKYSNWTPFKDVSNLDSTNANYREQQIDIHSRYRIHYNIVSLEIFKEYVSRDEIEKKLGKSISEIYQDSTIRIGIHYKYKYRKK